MSFRTKGCAHNMRGVTSPRTIAVLLYEAVNAIDVAGPLEAFAAVRDDEGARIYTPHIWSLGSLTVRSEAGLLLRAETTAPERPEADILIVPGGVGVREPSNLAGLSAWLRKHHSGFDRIVAICTGAYALAEAGLLEGRSVATHWAHARDLQRRYPGVRVDGDALFLKDGRFYSSGGVTAGIDLALDLIETDCGPRAAMEAARELVVFLRRTGGQTQFSAPLKLQAVTDGRLKGVCQWAAANLEADLSIEALAARSGLSSRQFSRCFRETFGVSPARHIQTLRLDAAREHLERGAPVALAAQVTGFRSDDAFRRAFERHFDVAPSEYQRRFDTSRSPAVAVRTLDQSPSPRRKSCQERQP